MMSPYLKTDKTRIQSPVVCNKRTGLWGGNNSPTPCLSAFVNTVHSRSSALRHIRGHQIGPIYNKFKYAIVFTFSRILACKHH